MDNVRKKLIWCIVGNGISLILVLVMILSTDINGTYWDFGPNDKLIIVSILIDNWFKYFCLLLVISIINIIKVISEDVGMPILNFNIYNPDKKIITDFGKIELQVMANSMYMITSIRELFLILVTISQVDIALFDVLIKGVVAFYTIKLLLTEKKFCKNQDLNLEIL